MTRPLDYSVVTPAHDEAANLPRLAASMSVQRIPPREWLIVDNGSTDETREVIRTLMDTIPWARTIYVPKENPAPRGAPIVRAMHAGIDALSVKPDVIVKLDADVSFADDFFERILGAFDDDPTLGIAGGLCLETDRHGIWRPARVTRDHVRGATRAYRAACLADVLPLEERMGWDAIDELRARVAGWTTRSLDDVPFWHHRTTGAREHPWQKWVGQGYVAHFVGYRPSYLLARTLYRAVREPRAIAMLWGYGVAGVRRERQYPDERVRRYLRDQQRIGLLPARVRETQGRAGARRPG